MRSNEFLQATRRQRIFLARTCRTILGIAGVRLLQALGHKDVVRFRMNEGHTALLTLASWRRSLEDPIWRPRRANGS
jgi:hypothetical protein